MENALKLALVQTDVVWQNAFENRIRYSEKMDNIKEDVDVIILPEMFSTGFSMQPQEVSETMQGETVEWMKKIASKKNAAICGSLIISEEKQFYNRFLFVMPNGEISFYNKRHLFSLAGEEKVYSQGVERKLIEFRGWKIHPLICYDLRFPVWARNVDEYDLLLYVANWPKPRIVAWDTLLKARAIENLCYTVGVNRVGADENGYEFSGHSAVYDCLGEKLTFSIPNHESVEIIELYKDHIEKVRSQLNFLNDKDTFEIVK